MFRIRAGWNKIKHATSVCPKTGRDDYTNTVAPPKSVTGAVLTVFIQFDVHKCVSGGRVSRFNKRHHTKKDKQNEGQREGDRAL